MNGRRLWTIAVSAGAGAALAVGGLAAVSNADGAGPAAGPRDASPTANAKAAAQALAKAKAQETHLPSTYDEQFHAIVPCRIMSTITKGGAIGSGKTRHVVVRGTSGFPAQGGTSGGCGVPASATSVSTSVTVSHGNATGHLTVWPYGASHSSTPRVSSYAKGATTTSTPVFRLSAQGSAGDLSVQASAKADVAIDVLGYYQPPIEGLVSPGGSVFSGTSRIISSTSSSTGVYTVTTDTDVSYCTPTVTPYFGTGLYASAYGFNGTKVSVYVWQIVSGTVTPTSSYFYLDVSC